ncbi:hypothetical protein chiPu_0031279, partial [Chiloscyllium punctatum]|nr:hypothetical protein [Chiloscyllium punctatum]
PSAPPKSESPGVRQIPTSAVVPDEKALLQQRGVRVLQEDQTEGGTSEPNNR